jgi:hypothetical protein
MPYGTLSISDLLATTTQSIAQGGPGYERAIWQVFENSLAAHNRIMNELLGEFVMRTTERLVGVGGVSTMQMDDLEEFGTPHAQKVAPGENMGFPLRLAGLALQWTLTYFKVATPADIAGVMIAAQDADRLRVTRDIKRAIFTATNTSFVDVRTKDKPTLPVKALANADGMSVPVGPNGETFVAATHNHYLGTASLTAADLLALITTVAEHYTANDIQVVINVAQEAAVRALAGFNAFVDARIVQSQTTVYAEGAYNLYQYNNRDIGIFNGATVSVRPWAIPSYIFAYNREAPPILAMRERSEGSGDFVMSYEDEDHPLRSKGFEREFGIAPRNRWAAAVLYTANATYASPTIT